MDYCRVTVFNSNQRQLAGVRIIITWDAGEEQFFTGSQTRTWQRICRLHHDPNITYTFNWHWAATLPQDLVAPTCQTPGGESLLGGIKLTFQQP
jgi:hypothetical protein